MSIDRGVYMNKKYVSLSIIILLLVIINIFAYNDDFLYSKEIIKVNKITTDRVEEEQNTLGIKEKYYYRKLSGTVMNGENKGKEKTISYEETYSSISTDKYKVGDKVIISHNSIDSLKRDNYSVLLFSIFILLIFIVGELKGLLSILSVLVNSIVFYIGLLLYTKSSYFVFNLFASSCDIF